MLYEKFTMLNINLLLLRPCKLKLKIENDKGQLKKGKQTWKFVAYGQNPEQSRDESLKGYYHKPEKSHQCKSNHNPQDQA